VIHARRENGGNPPCPGSLPKPKRPPRARRRIPSKARCSRLLNRLRLEAGGLVEYEEAKAWVWPDRKRPRSWRSQLATFAFMLRELGYPVVTVFGRGLMFVPRPWQEPVRQQRPDRQVQA